VCYILPFGITPGRVPHKEHLFISLEMASYSLSRVDASCKFGELLLNFGSCFLNFLYRRSITTNTVTSKITKAIEDEINVNINPILVISMCFTATSLTAKLIFLATALIVVPGVINIGEVYKQGHSVVQLTDPKLSNPSKS